MIRRRNGLEFSVTSLNILLLITNREMEINPEIPKGRGQKGKKGDAYEYKVKRFQFYDPTIKRMRVKVINLATSTEEEAEIKGRLWIEEMKANLEKRKKEIFSVPDEPFDIKRDKNSGLSVCMLASTRAGKTTLLEYMLENFFSDHISVLMTESLQSKAYDEIKKLVDCTMPCYNPKVVAAMYKINKGLDNKFEFLPILDDVIGEKNDGQVKKLLCVYRNSRLSSIFSMQSPILMNSTGRGNINHILLGHLNSDQNIETTIKMYLLSFFPSDLKMQDKIKLYKSLTSDYHFLHINNLEDKVCRIKISL